MPCMPPALPSRKGLFPEEALLCFGLRMPLRSRPITWRVTKRSEPPSHVRAIESPLRKLCDNAGVEGSLVVQQVLKSKGSMGYNVATDKHEDLIKAGVVDPTKVTRTALQNAGSVAGLLLTTDCMITDIPEEENPPRRT